MLFTSLRFEPALLATLVVSLCLMSPAPAQDQTAADLLEQGMAQYEGGNLEQARQTLQRIDKVQLDEDEQQTLQTTLQVIEAELSAQRRLAEAKRAEDDGNLEIAKRLYRQITADQNAPRTARREALRGLARVERNLMSGQVQPTEPQPMDDGQPITVPVEDTPDVQPEPMQPEPMQPEPMQPEAMQPEPVQPQTGQPLAIQPAESPAPSSQQIIERARTLRAQRLVAEAEAEAEAGNYNNAMKLYQQASNVDPANAAAQEGLENIDMLLRRGGSEGVLQDEVTALSLKRQRAVARYDDLMGEARKARQAGNYAQAVEAAGLAKSVLDTNRQYFDEQRYQQMRQQSLDLASAVRAEQEQDRARELAREQQRIERRSVEQRQRAQQERTAKVQELLRRARDLSREQRYDQALEQIDQILFIDRNNTAAQFMRDLIRDQQIAQRWHSLQKERGYEYAQLRNQSMADTVPTSDIIVYPPDWPELTQRRLGQQGQTTDSEVNRIAREKLRQPIPVDFKANRFENVIEYFRNVTGANMYVQWRTLEAAGIARETPITMQMNVAAEKALRLILDDVGGDLVNLGYTIDEGVIVIATQEFLAQETELQTYDIKDLVVQIPNFEEAPEFDLNQIVSDAADTGGGGGGGGIFGSEADEEVTIPRAERIQNIMDLIRSSIATDSWRAQGGLDSTMEELNGMLIVNTTSENHAAIVGLLRMLREQRALQIAVESRFLFVTQNFLEEVGIDVGVSYNAGSDNWLVGNPGFTQDSADLARARPTNVEGSLPDTLENSAIEIGSVAAGAAPGMASALGFMIDDLQVSVLITATQADVRSITVNTPRVTFFNGQRAYVTLSRQVAFVSDLEPVTATNSSAFDPEIGVVSDGVVLDVEGTISADRRYVTLTVRPSLAQLDEPIETFTVSGGGGLAFDASNDGLDNDGDGTIDEPGEVANFGFGNQQIQQPTVTLTTVRTTVSVPDKGTLLLGGQRLVGEVQREVGTPILSKVPVLNRIFTNRSTVRDERTLLILIKPTIIVQSEEEERLFPGLNQEPGVYNLGAQR